MRQWDFFILKLERLVILRIGLIIVAIEIERLMPLKRPKQLIIGTLLPRLKMILNPSGRI